MKRLKQRALYFALLLALGVVMLVCALLSGEGGEMLLSMGSAMVLVCVIRLVGLWRLSRDPEAGRKMDLACTEERVVFISQKAAQATLCAVVALQYAAMLAAVFLRQNEVATLLGFLVCGQLLVYAGFSRFYGGKY